MKDDYLASRAEDVREVGARLIRNLMQQHYNPFADAPQSSVMVAEEITPADTALMDPSRVTGFAAVLGDTKAMRPLWRARWNPRRFGRRSPDQGRCDRRSR